MNEKLTLTAILIKDPEGNGYTSFFAQFPEIIASGDNEDLTIDNLLSLSKKVFADYQEDLSDVKETQGAIVTTKKFNFIIEKEELK